MEKFLEITYLYDFYGQLLTDKQKELIGLYYLDDLSLGEIALQEGVSRQGVHNTIRTAEEKLMNFEQRLGLFERFKKQQTELQEIVNMMNEIKVEDSEVKSTIFHIIKRMQQLLSD